VTGVQTCALPILIHLDTSRIRALGWRPELTIGEAVVRTLRWLEENDYASSAAQPENSEREVGGQ
jgi:hypothetical protein